MSDSSVDAAVVDGEQLEPSDGLDDVGRSPAWELSIDELRAVMASKIESVVDAAQVEVDRLSSELVSARSVLADAKRDRKALAPAAVVVGGADEEFGCVECERSFASKQGLSMHVTRTHKMSASSKPALPDRATVDGRLVCGCGKRFDTAVHLGAHTEHVHGRPPTRAERTPQAG